MFIRIVKSIRKIEIQPQPTISISKVNNSKISNDFQTNFQKQSNQWIKQSSMNLFGIRSYGSNNSNGNPIKKGLHFFFLKKCDVSFNFILPNLNFKKQIEKQSNVVVNMSPEVFNYSFFNVLIFYE